MARGKKETAVAIHLEVQLYKCKNPLKDYCIGKHSEELKNCCLCGRPLPLNEVPMGIVLKKECRCLCKKCLAELMRDKGASINYINKEGA